MATITAFLQSEIKLKDTVINKAHLNSRLGEFIREHGKCESEMTCW